MPVFTLPYHITKEDYMLFNEHSIGHTKHGKKLLRLCTLFAPVLCVFALLIFLIADADTELLILEAIGMAVFCIIAPFFSKRCFLFFLKRHINKCEKKQTLPYSENGTLVFDEETIVDGNDRIEIKIPYAGVECVYITDVAYYLYIGPAQALLVPYHLFADQQEQQAFFSFIKAHIGTEKFIQ